MSENNVIQFPKVSIRNADGFVIQPDGSLDGQYEFTSRTNCTIKELWPASLAARVEGVTFVRQLIDQYHGVEVCRPIVRQLLGSLNFSVQEAQRELDRRNPAVGGNGKGGKGGKGRNVRHHTANKRNKGQRNSKK